MMSEVEAAVGQQTPSTALQDFPNGQADVGEHVDTGSAPETGHNTK